jgi:imidazolonepropionase-like amidohydrolase
MHTHVLGYPQVFFPLLLAHGVTGTRDMHGKFLDSLLLWRQEIASGARIGPRMVVTGGFLGNYGADEGWVSHMEVPTPERARAVVDSLKAAGADFIKIRQRIKRDVYFAIAAHTRRIGIPLVGHLSDSVTAAESSDSGQRTIEHDLLCHPPDVEEPGETSDAGCAALAAHLRRNGTWVTPTAIPYLNIFRGRLPDRAPFWPDSVLARVRQRSPDDVARDSTRFLRTILPRLAMLRRAGMPLLAGTDAAPLFPMNAPGFSLHEELALFQQAGFSPLEALQTATLNPARYLGATDSLGTIEVGKLADLVLLEADPLDDVTNATRVRAVVANGRYFDRAALDQLLAQTRHRPSTREP